MNSASLQGAVLSGANLDNTQLDSANFRGADLRGASLQQVRADANVEFSFADLRGVHSDTAIPFTASIDEPALVSDKTIPLLSKHIDWLITIPNQKYVAGVSDMMVRLAAAPELSSNVVARLWNDLEDKSQINKISLEIVEKAANRLLGEEKGRVISRATEYARRNGEEDEGFRPRGPGSKPYSSIEIALYD
ncbi:uncharacterized protein YjbI with pentapeptide repeats [Bradyrhizobium sp. F1.13.4]